MLKKLPVSLQKQAIKKIETFQDTSNHQSLRVHKLSGELDEQYSFSINYKMRIVFVYLPTKPRSAYLTAIGDHDVYDV